MSLLSLAETIVGPIPKVIEIVDSIELIDQRFNLDLQIFNEAEVCRWFSVISADSSERRFEIVQHCNVHVELCDRGISLFFNNPFVGNNYLTPFNFYIFQCSSHPIDKRQNKLNIFGSRIINWKTVHYYNKVT